MRMARFVGIGKEQEDRLAFKKEEMAAQRQEAAEFRDNMRREAETLLMRLRAQTRLRGGGDDDGHVQRSR